MLRVLLRSELLTPGLFFVFCLYFYISTISVKQAQYSEDKILARPPTEKWHRPPDPNMLNPELLKEPVDLSNDLIPHKNQSNNVFKPKIVVLLASLPRSGSTMIAEVLKSRKNTVLFFEPDHKTEFTECAAVPKCMSEYIRNILTCSFSDEFEKWQRRHFFPYFHQNVKDCQSNQCKTQVNMRSMCKESEFTITKLIRVRLGFLDSLLSDSSVDVKIIHLVRDPRGALISNKKMGWVSNPLLKCSYVYDDLLAYEYLKNKFNHQIMQVKYEKFCLDPMGITKSMFLFAYGDSELPKNTIDFVKKHTEVMSRGAMNTERKSSEQYQKWRWEINEKTFMNIEKEEACRKCLNKMDYRIFETIQNVKNSELSLFLNTDQQA